PGRRGDLAVGQGPALYRGQARRGLSAPRGRTRAPAPARLRELRAWRLDAGLGAQAQKLAAALFRWSWSTLASGSTTSVSGSNGQVIVISCDSPLPRVTVALASWYSAEGSPDASNRRPRAAATSTGIVPVPTCSIRTVAFHVSASRAFLGSCSRY